MEFVSVSITYYYHFSLLVSIETNFSYTGQLYISSKLPFLQLSSSKNIEQKPSLDLIPSVSTQDQVEVC